MKYLVLLSEGGIVQFEYLYDNEKLAAQHMDVWLIDSDEDRDAYLYRISTPFAKTNIVVERSQGDAASLEYFRVD